MLSELLQDNDRKVLEDKEQMKKKEEECGESFLKQIVLGNHIQHLYEYETQLESKEKPRPTNSNYAKKNS